LVSQKGGLKGAGEKGLVEVEVEVEVDIFWSYLMIVEKQKSSVVSVFYHNVSICKNQ